MRYLLDTNIENWLRGTGGCAKYYPKGTDLSAISQAQLDTVARKLNTRPRETLHWRTPACMLVPVFR